MVHVLDQHMPACVGNAAGADARSAAALWEAWDARKGSFLFHVELVCDILMHVLTLVRPTVSLVHQ